jgi:serine/threonine-protein kinase
MMSRTSWDRWPEVDGLFAQALERPPEERVAFLAEACHDDAALLETLTELLAASEKAEEAFGGPADVLVREAFQDDEDEDVLPPRTAGETVGRYRIVRELGQGGMATVYEAERADGTYEQRVAVKLLRHIDSPDIARRFQVETQILSSLTHPHIARLLDGGTTDDGQPYLVMELVVGEPVTEWADRHQLDIDGRLALFTQVADAVGFAHKHLIVHRDLKPSNVLVGHDGTVKLLDFGIAKLLEAEGPTATETQAATRWMTPGYASPEQILGRPVTTATDVHGLGLLLYELLAGKRPFGGEGVSGFDLDKAICEQIPTRPSSVVTQSARVAAARGTDLDRLRRRLSGDLDAIVGKALRKEPDERYASVQAMAKDIERHRTGFPVDARAGLRTYRARKFISRHRLGVGATAAIVVTLAISSITFWRQQVATADARDEAATEAENAGLVIDFLADVFRGRNPEQAPADTLTVRELLAWADERVSREFADRPVLQAQLYEVLGSAYGNLGLTRNAMGNLGLSVALTREAVGDRSPELAHRLAMLSVAVRADRHASAALPFAREALEIRRSLFGESDTTVAYSMVTLALVHTDLDQVDSSVFWLEQARDIYRRTIGEDDRRYVTTLTNLARAYRGAGRLREAAQLYQEAIPRLRELGSDYATELNNYAFLLRTLGDYAGAEPLYREGLEMIANVYGRGHPQALQVATNLASVLHLQGKRDDAEAALRDNVFAAEAQWPDGDWRVGGAHASLARFLLRTGRFDEALTVFGTAHAIYLRFFGADHMWTWFLEATVAAGYLASGRPDIGQPHLDRFYQNRVDYPPRNPAEEQALVNLVQPFVAALEDLNLDAEAERFRALIEPYVSETDEGIPLGN